MKTKIKEVQDYFIRCIEVGAFTIVEFTESSVEIDIDGHKFNLLPLNGKIYSHLISTFMTLPTIENGKILCEMYEQNKINVKRRAIEKLMKEIEGL